MGSQHSISRQIEISDPTGHPTKADEFKRNVARETGKEPECRYAAVGAGHTLNDLGFCGSTALLANAALCSARFLYTAILKSEEP